MKNDLQRQIMTKY